MTTKKTDVRAAVLRLEEELNAAFPERADVVRGLLVAAVAGEHVCLIGPPGTAKSALTRAFSEALGSSYFEWLMTRYTTPEEVFGPVSLAGLQQDRMTRVTRGKLPEAEVAFLDECFKANSAILNALLAAVNEKVFHDDGQAKQIPLRIVVGASNELPTDSELEAFYDRFLFRFLVLPVTSGGTFGEMVRGTLPRVTVKLDPGALDAARAESDRVAVSDDLVKVLYDLRYKVASESIPVSDRRWVKVVRALKAAAWLDGSPQVDEEQLDVVKHMLWSTPQQIGVVAGLVAKLASPVLVDANEFHDAIMAKLNALDPTKPVKDPSLVVEVRKVADRLKALGNTAKSPRAQAKIAALHAAVVAQHEKIRLRLMTEMGL